MTAMDITIHQTFLPYDDPDASLAFYRGTPGFEIRNDVVATVTDPDGNVLGLFQDR